MNKYRVIQWGTGQTGTAALGAIIDHPDLELVGLRVFSDGKKGRDAGEITDRPATGVTATNDVDALMALDADCVCYSATDMFGTDHVMDEICTILASGKDMTGTTITRLSVPDMVPELRDRIAAACEEGGSTFHWTGINPGFVLDLVPAIAATGVGKIERIEVTEYLCPSTRTSWSATGWVSASRPRTLPATTRRWWGCSRCGSAPSRTCWRRSWA